MNEHTKGPWHVGGAHGRIIYAADGYAIADATVFHGRHGDAVETATANAARIVACVNACAQMDNPEHGIRETDAFIQRQARSIATLQAERDALRAALEDAEFLMRKAGQLAGPMQDSFNRSATDARAALAFEPRARGEG